MDDVVTLLLGIPGGCDFEQNDIVHLRGQNNSSIHPGTVYFTVRQCQCVYAIQLSNLAYVLHFSLQEAKDDQWKTAMDYLKVVSELNYMTQIVIMLYEDPNKVLHHLILIGLCLIILAQRAETSLFSIGLSLL